MPIRNHNLTGKMITSLPLSKFPVVLAPGETAAVEQNRTDPSTDGNQHGVKLL